MNLVRLCTITLYQKLDEKDFNRLFEGEDGFPRVIQNQLNRTVNILKRKLLYDACEQGLFDVVRYLAKNKTDTRHHDRALAWAAARGHLDIVKYLVEICGANIRSNNSRPLEWAAEDGCLGVIKYFEEHNLSTKDITYIFIAAVVGDKQNIARYLVEKYGSVVRSVYSEALGEAADLGHLNMVKYLVEECGAANVNAIQWAADNEHRDVVKYLKSVM